MTQTPMALNPSSNSFGDDPLKKKLLKQELMQTTAKGYLGQGVFPRQAQLLAERDYLYQLNSPNYCYNEQLSRSAYQKSLQEKQLRRARRGAIPTCVSTPTRHVAYKAGKLLGQLGNSASGLGRVFLAGLASSSTEKKKQTTDAHEEEEYDDRADYLIQCLDEANQESGEKAAPSVEVVGVNSTSSSSSSSSSIPAAKSLFTTGDDDLLG